VEAGAGAGTGAGAGAGAGGGAGAGAGDEPFPPPPQAAKLANMAEIKANLTESNLAGICICVSPCPVDTE